MSKPIKEIGREMQFCDSSPDAPHELHSKPVIIMSLGERRELVTRVLLKLCMEWIYPEEAWEEVKSAAVKQIEGLIKSEGL